MSVTSSTAPHRTAAALARAKIVQIRDESEAEQRKLYSKSKREMTTRNVGIKKNDAINNQSTSLYAVRGVYRSANASGTGT